MDISVLGTGTVGRALAAKLFGLGHSVTLGTRDPKAKLNSTKTFGKEALRFDQWMEKHKGINLAAFSEAVQDQPVVFNCTPGLLSLTILAAVGYEALKDKVLVDVANPVDFSKGIPPSLNPVNNNSLGEQIQHYLPRTKVVKALNTMNVDVMVDPQRIGGMHNTFICGNDEDAKRLVRDIVQSMGWSDQQIIDLGSLVSSRGLEMMLVAWVQIWQNLGTTQFNFSIVRSESHHKAAPSNIGVVQSS